MIHYVEQWIDDLPFDGDGDNSNENFGRLDCNRIPDEEKPSKYKSIFFSDLGPSHTSDFGIQYYDLFVKR